MANLIRRNQGTGGRTRPARVWDPFRVMREVLRWDPFREVEAASRRRLPRVRPDAST